MRGLWVKDLLLLQKQLKTFLMFMLIAAFNAYTIKSVPVIFHYDDILLRHDLGLDDLL